MLDQCSGALVPELNFGWPLVACTATLACRRKSAESAQKKSAMTIENHTARSGNFHSVALDPPFSSASSTARCNRPDVVPAMINLAPKRGSRGVGFGRTNNTAHEIAEAIVVCTIPTDSSLRHNQPSTPTRTHDVTLRNTQPDFSALDETIDRSLRCRNSVTSPVTPAPNRRPTL